MLTNYAWMSQNHHFYAFSNVSEKGSTSIILALGLIIDSKLNWKAHLSAIGTKISRVIGLLHKLKHILPKQVLHSIYNSLIMPHLNYSLLA